MLKDILNVEKNSRRRIGLKQRLIDIFWLSAASSHVLEQRLEFAQFHR
jgi:hypothetical protein